MSLFNMQDGVVKSSLVQQVQHRAAEVGKVHQATMVTQSQEQARMADEVVLQTHQAEGGEVRADEENTENGQRQQKRRRGQGQPDEADNGENDSGEHGESGPHLIDITI
ncbi:MAG: hypothetical protein JXR97_11880 [Planctomycetes bacterium]|nr:hypothetical protein [Planctomycetota bacterium]